jgi:hypothetical protein
MVENPRATLQADAYKSVNAPEHIEVKEDTSGLPLAVRSPRNQAVIAIENRWRIDDEWWRRKPVSRLYCYVLLASGQRLILYKDLIEDCWYRQSY